VIELQHLDLRGWDESLQTNPNLLTSHHPIVSETEYALRATKRHLVVPCPRHQAAVRWQFLNTRNRGAKNRRMGFAAVVCSTVVGFWVAASLALTQQKTVEACQAEWRANKAVFQPMPALAHEDARQW
jgi:hypothetical protein